MKKSLASLLVLSVLTTACVPVALVGAGAAVGGRIASDSRSLQTMSDDSAIKYDAEQKIQSDANLTKNSSITVTVFNRVVLLTGQVPSDAMKVKAESLVQTVPNIRRVYNQLHVAPIVGMIQTADDATISANINARMMVTSNLNSNNFKYVVENKVVYLMGYASREQTNMAIKVIRNSSGVKRVVNLVEYDDSAASDGSNSSANTINSNVNNPAPVESASETPSTSVDANSGAKVSAVNNDNGGFKPVTDATQATVAQPGSAMNASNATPDASNVNPGGSN